MDAIDGTEHTVRASEGPPPSLLVIILDINPFAWSLLSPALPLSTAVASLIVFINAHLAFSHENKVAILASHCQRTYWLYPCPSSRPKSPSKISTNRQTDDAPVNGTGESASPYKEKAATISSSANKYGPFASVESSILTSLNQILSQTSPDDITAKNATSTPVAGALSMALNYINRQMLAISHTTNSSSAEAVAAFGAGGAPPPLNSRILVLSTSGDLASQYIPLMNAMFAAQNGRVPIDILKLAGDSALLQQASFTTGGIFIQPDGLPSISQQSSSKNTKSAPGKGEGMKRQQHQISLLPYLMHALLPDTAARQHIYAPTSPHVDFRAACFCHRRVVDIGYVCSICLSIFCSSDLPGGAVCLTCGTKLQLGEAGESLVTGDSGRKKDKKKKKNKEVRDSGVGSPAN